MTTSKYRKIIQKIEKFSKEELKRIKITDYKQYVINKLFLEMDEAYLDWISNNRKAYVFQNNIKNLHIFEILILNYTHIEKALKNINVPSKDKYEFLEYIVEEVVNFLSIEENLYKFLNTMTYQSMLEKMLEKGQCYEEAKLSVNMLDLDREIYEIIYNYSNKNKNVFLVISKDCQKRKEEKAYLEQKQLLLNLDLDTDFINQLKEDINIEKVKVIENDIQAGIALEVQTILNEISPKEETRPMSDKDNSLKESKVKNKEMLKQLKQYINPITLETYFILDEEEIKKILELVTILYGEEVANKMKHAILENNQKKINEKMLQIYELLISEERKNLYNSLYNYCYLYQGQEIQYKPIILSYFNEINNLIKEYSNEEDELLIPDYKEQIDLIFSELDTYLPYLPVDIFTGPQRT